MAGWLAICMPGCSAACVDTNRAASPSHCIMPMADVCMYVCMYCAIKQRTEVYCDETSESSKCYIKTGCHPDGITHISPPATATQITTQHEHQYHIQPRDT